MFDGSGNDRGWHNPGTALLAKPNLCHPITYGSFGLLIDATTFKVFAKVNFRFATPRRWNWHDDVSKSDFAEIDQRDIVAYPLDLNRLLFGQRNMLLGWDFGNFFDEQISEPIRLTFLAVVLDSDVTTGISRVTETRCLNSVDFDRDKIFPASNDEAVPTVSIKCIGDLWLLEEGLGFFRVFQKLILRTSFGARPDPTAS